MTSKLYEDEVAEAQKMETVQKGSLALRVCNIASFAVVIALNSLGSVGLLTGKSVSDISHDNPTKITPAGYAFSIWGLIYTLLSIFSIWQLLPAQRYATELLDEKIGWLFVLSNAFNSAWIVTWVQGSLAALWISSILLFALVGSVMAILVRGRLWQESRDTVVEFVAVDCAFSVYAGWITAASIVNVSIALKASGFNGGGWPQENWSALICVVAACIYLVHMYKTNDGVYGLVFCGGCDRHHAEQPRGHHRNHLLHLHHHCWRGRSRGLGMGQGQAELVRNSGVASLIPPSLALARARSPLPPSRRTRPFIKSVPPSTAHGFQDPAAPICADRFCTPLPPRFGLPDWHLTVGQESCPRRQPAGETRNSTLRMAAEGTEALDLSRLLTQVTSPIPHTSPKVSIVGTGSVGMACAFAMITQGHVSRVALMDLNKAKADGEAADLRHGAAFVKPVTIESGGDAAVTAGSDVIVLTAGARQRVGETRVELVGRNAKIFAGMVPPLLEASPNAVIIVVSNPCDALTSITAAIARGMGWPEGRVFGSGTCLDSSRFRSLLSSKLGVASSNVHAYILGEHGDTSVPVWSQAFFGGLRLADRLPGLLASPPPPDGAAQAEREGDDDPLVASLRGIPEEVVQAAYSVIKAKGYTNWAIGLAAARLCEAVLRNDRAIIPVSVPAKGHHGIVHEVCLSLPAVVGERGVEAVVNMQLSPEEERLLRVSADAVHQMQLGLSE